MNQGIFGPQVAPSDLNSIAKIAEALAGDPRFAATIADALAGKASLAGLAAGTEVVGLAAGALGVGSIAQTVAEKLGRRVDFADLAALDLTGGSDTSSAFDAIRTKNNVRVHFPPGTLRLDSSKIISAQSAQWIGAGNKLTRITSATLRTLFTFSASPAPQDLLFEDIWFDSSYTAASEATASALVYMQNTPAQRIVFNRCRFSCPNTGANAVKIVAETNSSPVEDVYFIDCVFENISRMAFEAQSHADNAMRYRRIHLIRCRFKATGLTYQGQAISFSGFTVSCNTQYCTFDDVANIPLEYVRGGVGCHIIGNEWINCTRGTYLFLIGQSSSTDRWSNCTIRDNRTLVQSSALGPTDDQVGLVLIANIDNSFFSGNYWRTADYVEFRDCANNEIFGDWYDGRGSYGLLVSSGSTRNQFHGIQARTDRSSTAFSAIRFHGSGTTLNELFTGRARKGSIGAEVDEANSAVGNILHWEFNIADSMPSGEADVTLSGATFSIPFHWSQRKAFIWGGTPGATVTVTFPPYGHFALHQNTTAQSVVVKPSGGAGPTLAAGEKALVYGSASAWSKSTLA